MRLAIFFLLIFLTTGPLRAADETPSPLIIDVQPGETFQLKIEGKEYGLHEAYAWFKEAVQLPDRTRVPVIFRSYGSKHVGTLMAMCKSWRRHFPEMYIAVPVGPGWQIFSTMSDESSTALQGALGKPRTAGASSPLADPAPNRARDEQFRRFEDATGGVLSPR